MTEGFLLGISTGSFCLLYCFPVALPFLLSEDLSQRGTNLRLVLLFLLGRLLAYILVGSLLGVLAAQFLGLAPQFLTSTLLPWVFVVLGASMLATGVAQSFPHAPICRAIEKAYPPSGGALWLGLLTGVNLCPPFLAAAARVLAHPGAVYGSIYFLFFYLGTAVYFLPLLGFSWLQKHLPSVRMVARLTLMIMGGYFLVILGLVPLIL